MGQPEQGAPPWCVKTDGWQWAEVTGEPFLARPWEVLIGWPGRMPKRRPTVRVTRLRIGEPSRFRIRSHTKAPWGKPVLLGAPDSAVTRLRRACLTDGVNTVCVVEHLLAVLHLLGLTSVQIDFTGSEVPLLDGRGLAWANALQPLVPSLVAKSPPVLQHPVTVSHGPATAVAERAEETHLSYTLDFSRAPRGWRGIRPQTVDGEMVELTHAMLEARSFGLDWQGQLAFQLGLLCQNPRDLALQYRWNSSELVNPTLRTHPHEEGLHKLLDFVGDMMAWLGHVPIARYRIERGGHALHAALARAMRAANEQS